MPISNILDPVHDELDPRVFDDPGAPEPIFKQQHQDWIESNVRKILEDAGYTHIDDWLSLVLTGSLTTYQYSDESDVDVSFFVDAEVFPGWSRAEMIGLMVENMDGKILPGTPHPMQCFVVPPEVKREDLYQPGLRSGWDFKTRSWIVPPDKTRVHDVEKEMNSAYVMGLEAADKMEHLLRYEPDKAVQYWHQIHKRRQRDQKAGKGDYSDSNIVYKFLANRGLFPEISQVSGEYIAKTAGLVPYTGPRRFVVDKAAVRRAGRDLGLSKAVEVIQVGGTYGTVLDQPDRYLIGVVGWLKPDSASRQIWHELRHAQQIDQGLTDILTTEDIPYEEYSQLPYEQDARSWSAEQEYPLTYDVRTSSNHITWQPGEKPGKAIIVNGEVHAWPVDEYGSPHHGDYMAQIGLIDSDFDDLLQHTPQVEIDPDGTVRDLLDGRAENSRQVANAIGGTVANDWHFGKQSLFGIGEPDGEDFSYYRDPEHLPSRWQAYHDYATNPGMALGEAADKMHQLNTAFSGDQVTPERYETALDEIKNGLTQRGIDSDLLPVHEGGRTFFRPSRLYVYSPKDLTQKGWKPTPATYGFGSLDHLKSYQDQVLSGEGDLYEVHNPGPMISLNHPYNYGKLRPAGKNKVAPENIRRVEPWELLPPGQTDGPQDNWSFSKRAAWPVVRKFVYDATTDRLIVGEEGPEEGSEFSHNQLCQQLGLEGLGELHGIAGTINKDGWVQFEYQREQKGGNSAKTRYQAEQALKAQVPDIQGFLGGETSDTLKQLWNFSSLSEPESEPTGTA